MRLYLDTNILVFLLLDEQSIGRDVFNMFYDYSNTVHTSEVCVHELIHLVQIGKVRLKKRKSDETDACEILSWLHSKGIEIEPTEKHLAAYASLPMLRDHRDPFDRLIIAQAMADKATLVTSDTKMPLYMKYGLKLVLNVR